MVPRPARTLPPPAPAQHKRARPKGERTIPCAHRRTRLCKSREEHAGRCRSNCRARGLAACARRRVVRWATPLHAARPPPLAVGRPRSGVTVGARRWADRAVDRSCGRHKRWATSLESGVAQCAPRRKGRCRFVSPTEPFVSQRGAAHRCDRFGTPWCPPMLTAGLAACARRRVVRWATPLHAARPLPLAVGRPRSGLTVGARRWPHNQLAVCLLRFQAERVSRWPAAT